MEAAVWVLLCSPGGRSSAIYCCRRSQRSRPQPRRVGCLELSFVEGRTACSLHKQIPRWEPIRGCHGFPDEIPDLVCCVFLKTRPLPHRNLSRGRETFLIELLVFERVSGYIPHFHGLHTPLFPLTASVESPRWQSVDVISGRPCITQMGKLRPGEAKEESHRLSWSPGLGQTQISLFQSRYSSSFIRGHKWAGCGHLYPTDVLSLARECFNLNELPAFKNQEIPYKNPAFWLLFDHWEMCPIRSAFLHGDS